MKSWNNEESNLSHPADESRLRAYSCGSTITSHLRRKVNVEKISSDKNPDHVEKGSVGDTKPPLPPKTKRPSSATVVYSQKSDNAHVLATEKSEIKQRNVACEVAESVTDSTNDGENNLTEPVSCKNTFNDRVSYIDENGDVTDALLEEHCDNVPNNAESETTPLNQDNNHNNHSGNIGGEPQVVHHHAKEEERSWSRLLEARESHKRAREAVAVLNSHQSHDRSPFGYKSWILRLSRKRRLEIIMVVGLFLWIAFVIVLALFMNGQPAKSDVDGDTDADAKIAPENRFTESHNLLPWNGTATTALFTPKNEILSRVTTTTHSSPAYLPDTTSAAPLLSATSTETVVSRKNAPLLTALASSISPTQKVMRDAESTTVYQTTLQPKANISDTTSSSVKRELETHNASSTVTTDFVSTASVERSTSDVPETALPNQRLVLSQQTSTSKGYKIAASSFPPAISVSDENITMMTEIKGYHSTVTLNQLLYDVPPPESLSELLKGKQPNYLVGVGRADITGPVADVNMMGYGNPDQVTGGLHIRQYARTFIIGQGNSRIVLVNTDACMGSILVKLEVLKVLRKMYGELYNANNLCISATHTHSAPAGFLQETLFQITSKGYVPETLKAMVNGIVESIRMAHDGLAPGSILINKGELLNSNINRSPSAYLNNPESERKKYTHNVDKDMIVLKFLDSKGQGIGMLNWFPVHCTSMNNTNLLISGDNKGYAALMFEHKMDPKSLVGESKFVAAFAQGNEGDASPNTRGPHCLDTGLPCDGVHSTCNGKVQNCVASGPGKDMFESAQIIGHNQFMKALELYNTAALLLAGPVQAVSQYIDMTNQNIALNSTHNATTCKPAMGFSFPAGTTDGPGVFDFKQGDRNGNAFWSLIRNFLFNSPSQEQIDCHAPKPILLDTGEMSSPYPWQPEVVDTQMFRVGQLLISAVPGEFTTMAGRRLRDTVLESFSENFSNERFESVVAGLSNTYSNYITTFEEYHVQRYEGASTVYGPHTLSAYIQQYKKLASSLIKKSKPQNGAEVQDIKGELYSFVIGVIADSRPFGYSFGSVLKQVNSTYNVGDVVEVQFVSGNPRNSPTFNMTYLTVEKKSAGGSWKVLHTDASWSTKFIWERSSTLGSIRGLSEATVKWEIPTTTSSGYYRIKHYGHYKWFFNRAIYPYEGRSDEFFVVGKDSS